MTFDQIIQFILSNLFFVVLIIGGLLSFFKRAAQGGQQQEKQMGWPGRDDQQPAEVDWKEIFKQEAPNKPEQPRTEPEVVSFEPVEPTPVQTKNEELYNRLEEMRKRRDQVEKQVESSQRTQSKTKQREGLDLKLNRLSNQEAMKAVVWAEVLGKPRSRQPHQTFNQRTRIR